MLKLKRVYESVSKEDGYRVLVDKLWPRGLTKGEAKVNLWFKEISPSYKLRKWYGHKIEKWHEFRKRYISELKKNREAIERFRGLIREKRNLTLLFGAKDEEHDQADVLKEYLESQS